MAEREQGITMERVFPAPRDLVWALVADTNRWDRCSGLTPGTYEWREHEGRWERFARAKEMGFEIEWSEPPYEWLEGFFVSGERDFVKGPVSRGGFRARLTDVEGGTNVQATAYVVAGGTLGGVLGAIMKGRFRRALTRYLDSIDEVLRRTELTGDLVDQPAVIRVRRALSAGYDSVTSGPRTPANEAVLSRRTAELRRAGVEAVLAERLVTLVRERPDEEVSQIRPFELARIWNADRRDVLRTFLQATVSGIVDLRWQINCPVCRVAAGVVGTLEQMQTNIHCQACNIDYGVDFGDQVEAVFQSNPAIRSVHAQVYCASSPSFLPHVWAQITLDPKETREENALFPVGRLHLRTPSSDGTARTVDVEIAAPNTLVEVVVHVDQLEASVKPSAGPSGLLRIVNRTGRAATVLVERSAWAADAVLGSVVASFPEFLDLFATEAPASGVDLSIGHLALLFSDLTGSTALYRRVGDARAFAIVEEHFRIMEEIVRAHEGAVVKTMGDAVMATFPSVDRATAAGIEMVRACEQAHGELGLAVKIGAHAGACLAVRANDRLDFFGTTVNVAARLQGQAAAGEIVLTRASAEAVDELVRELPARRFDATLKGIEEEQALVGLDARRSAPGLQARAVPRIL